MESTKDFIIRSNGNCFICLNRLFNYKPSLSSSVFLIQKEVNLEESESEGNSLLRVIQSLQCLQRYLKLDLSKVLVNYNDNHNYNYNNDNDDGSIRSSNDLVDKLRMSNLKVELCDKCELINQNFSKLFGQLEKIEMEMSGYLTEIFEKIKATSDENDKDSMKTEEVDDFNAERLQILESLRKEIVNKCFRKLNLASQVKVGVYKLTESEISEEKLKLKHISSTLPTSITVRGTEDLESDPNLDFDTADIKLEVETSTSDYETTANDYDYDNDEDDGDPQTEYFEDPLAEDMKPLISLLPTPETPSKNQQKTKSTIPPAEIIQAAVTNAKLKLLEQPKIDAITGKPICKICLKHYSNITECKKHFRSIHLKQRYRCPECKTDLCDYHAYRRHYQSKHLGIKIQCGRCGKGFDKKWGLIRHERAVHFGMRFPCQYCLKTFASSDKRNEHMRKNCEKNFIKRTKILK